MPFLPQCLQILASAPVRRAVLVALALGGGSNLCLGSTGPIVAKGGVTSGSATITQAGAVTTVDQITSSATINWLSFNTTPGETINFLQPSTTAVTLNRVIGNEATVFQGALNATGNVFLVNSSGVLFTRGSSVNAAGFLATTLDPDDSGLASGRLVLAGAPAGAGVTNLGTITVRPGGFVALIGDSVANGGAIVAPQGHVALASGSRVALQFDGGLLVGLTLDAGALAALAENSGAIRADGGQVLLTAKAAGDVLSAQVNNAGLVQARTVDDLAGHIVLDATGGTVHIGGTLDASASVTGDGGFIETSGGRVVVADDAVVTTRATGGRAGNWLIDPDGFTIGAGGDISGAALGTALASTNVTLSSTQGHGTDGNIEINDAVSWSANTTLTLNATHDIVFNAPLTATGAHAGLVMNYGGYATTGTTAAGADYLINNLTVRADDSFTVAPTSVTLSGVNATLAINGQSYTLIHTLAELAALSPPTLDARGNPVLDPNTGLIQATAANGNFALAQDLDAAGTVFPHWVVSTLNGTFAGLGHAIRNLTISSTTVNSAGQIEDASLFDTFGSDTTSRLRDLGLVDMNINGTLSAAGLVTLNFGTVTNVYATGTLTGSQPVGGVAAWNLGTIDNAHVDLAVSALQGGTDVGGLVGSNQVTGLITDSTARGTVLAAGIQQADGGLVASTEVGGLVGGNAGVIDHVSANVAVTTVNSTDVGGLVGSNINVFGDASHGVVSNASAQGTLSVTWGNSMVFGFSYGGLVGDNNGGYVSNSSAAVAISLFAPTNVGGVGVPITYVGGLVGSNETFYGIGGGVITDSTASGSITGYGESWQVGGAVGYNFDGTLTGVHATGNVITGSGGINVGGLVGMNVIGSIASSSASGRVTGNNQVGGLVGTNGGSITDSAETGNVYAQTEVGGLVGHNGGAVTGSSASGAVSGTDSVGGLVGTNFLYDFGDGNVSNGVVTGSTATGPVSGVSNVGGLAGYNGGIITGSSATGNVTGAINAGSLVGANGGDYAPAGSSFDGSVTQSTASGSVTSAGVTSGRLVGSNGGTLAGNETTYVASPVAGALELAASLTFPSSTPPSAFGSSAGHPAVRGGLDDHISYADASDYGADVDSITVDGVTYHLRGTAADHRETKPH